MSKSFVARTEPGTHVLPRSLRSRSTIMTFSARSFALVRSASASARSPSAVRGARTCALDRLGLDAIARDAQEQLRRRAEHAAVRKIEIRRERRGVDLAEPQVRRPRIAVRARLETLREVDLIAIAHADVLLHAAKRARVFVAAHGRVRARENAKRRVGLRGVASREPLEQARPPLEGACVTPETDESRTALLVIDDNGPIVDADRELGHVDVGGRDAGQALEATAEVVTEIADRPAAKRQVVDRRTADSPSCALSSANGELGE